MESERGRWAEFTGATATEVITGRFWNRYMRFTDAMEMPRSNMLVVEDCLVRPIEGVRVKEVPPSRVVINRQQLVFAIPGAEVDAEPRPPDVLVPKIPHRIAFEAGGWIITGLVHLAAGMRPEQVLDRLGKVFFPLTGATATFARSPSTEFRAGVLVLNGAQVSLMWPDGHPDE